MKRKASRNEILSPPFDLRISKTGREGYNALNDPHANYYFISQAARQRLKDLKKDLRKSKQKMSSEQRSTLKFLNDKIKHKVPKIKLPLLNGRQNEKLNKSARKHSENIHIKLTQISKQRNESQQRQSRIQTQAKQQLRSQLERSITHEDFLSFLAEKKNRLREQPL